jgi:hypothetical protein
MSGEVAGGWGVVGGYLLETPCCPPQLTELVSPILAGNFNRRVDWYNINKGERENKGEVLPHWRGGGIVAYERLNIIDPVLLLSTTTATKATTTTTSIATPTTTAAAT